MERVSFYACDSYEDRAALRRALSGIIEDAGGFERLFARGKRVVIKPNLVMKKAPQHSATTHPALLEELLLLLLEHTDKITLVECPGGLGTPQVVESIHRVTGMREVCDRYEIPIVTEPVGREVEVQDHAAAAKLLLSEEMLSADVFINVGKLKSHSLTTFTGCAKNLYGAIPGLMKVEYHARFAEVEEFAKLICDINRTLVPTLNVLDAVVGMEGNGPTGGTPRKIGGVLGGVNAFATDVLGARLIGLRAQDAPLLREAFSEGLAEEEIECVGDDYRPYVLSDFLFADAQRFSVLRKMPDWKWLCRFLEPRPVISARCVGCGECVRLCPKKAIRLVRHAGKTRAEIRAKECIRCYCCQELCPAKAVDTKSRKILKL